MGNRIHRSMFLPAICLVAACAGSPSEDPNDPGLDSDPVDPATLDADGDGLSDEDEANLGLDPTLADSDNDGLDDGSEVAGGTDPLVRDTDKDGYNDADEVSAGTDPLDPGSLIYVGGWPYNRDKAALENPTFAGPLGAVSAAERFPDLVGFDQFGDLVHLYDFANKGKPVVLDFSAQWCVPCMNLADYMGGANNSLPYSTVRSAVDAGDVFWITVMIQDINYGLPTATTSAEWAADFPDDAIPVLSPPNPAASIHYIDLMYYPTSVWLDDQMNVALFSNQDPYLALDGLETELR